jgi:membrane protein DedA with SNARE-associated domain
MMVSHHTAASTVAFVERHGYILLFLWVFAEQSALPLPSIPLLLASGALIRTGRLGAVPAVACCAIGAGIADSIWFYVGKGGGRRVLRLLCRVSLEPDSCVRQTENAFLKYGLRGLLVSKFIPGLNTVAAPLAGNSKAPYRTFLLYDLSGAALWSGAYLGLGYLFSEQLETLLAYASQMGSSLVALVLVLTALWIARKWFYRQQFLRQLRVDRITPEELRSRLDAGEDLFIVDMRTSLSGEAELIPGARRIASEELTARGHELPRDKEIILLCS